MARGNISRLERRDGMLASTLALLRVGGRIEGRAGRMSPPPTD
jgi:hypothetical protein